MMAEIRKGNAKIWSQPKSLFQRGPVSAFEKKVSIINVTIIDTILSYSVFLKILLCIFRCSRPLNLFETSEKISFKKLVSSSISIFIFVEWEKNFCFKF